MYIRCVFVIFTFVGSSRISIFYEKEEILNFMVKFR